MNYIKHYLLAVVCTLMVLSSCKDDWDDRTSLQDQFLNNTDLWEEISTQSNLSTFKEILIKTGYAQRMSADYDISVLTLFAPTDEAFEDAFNNGVLDKQKFMADESALKAFLDRHIANTIQMADLSKDPYRVKMWDGRSLYFAPKPDAQGIMYVDEDIPLSEANIICKNGVIHTIGSIVPDRLDVWNTARTLLTSNGDPLQLLNAFSRFDYRAMNDSLSRIKEYQNDRPVYDTIWTESNRILDFKDISNEDTVYTYVVLKDEGYIPLSAKYGKIYKRNDSSESDSLIIINLNLDLIFPDVLNLQSAGEYESVTGVRVKLDPSNLILKQRASNGYVYVLSTASITFRNNKVKDVIVEGENTLYTDAHFESKSYTTTLIEGDTFLRGKLWKTKYRTWASGNIVLHLGGFFRDQGNNYDPVSTGGDRTQHYSFFTKVRPQVFSVPYSLYWRMGNDYPRDNQQMIAQRIYISDPETLNEARVRNGSLRIDYNEIYDKKFADTAALYPAMAVTGGPDRDADRPTYAFYASIQDSVNYNRWLNNQYAQDTIYADKVKAWLLENNRFESYNLRLTADSDMPKPGIDSTYTKVVEPDTTYFKAEVLAANPAFIFDYYKEARLSDTFPSSKAILKTIDPTRATYLDRYDNEGFAHPDKILMVAFPDPNTGWKESDYYTLEKYPNHEQQLYLTYAYQNGDYASWYQNKSDAAYNCYDFSSYGEAVLLVTRNFTGIGSSNTFQQNPFVTIDYVRLQPNLDDIDE